MDYSVVILSFNSERYMGKCLESLVDAFESLAASYEIFVIDNGSKDQSRAIVEQLTADRQANIDLTAFDHNTGTTFSRNHGLRRCKGSRIIILDSDAYVNAEAIDTLAKALEANQKCAVHSRPHLV